MVRRTFAPVFDGFLLPICLRGLRGCWLERAPELITRCTVREYAFFFSVGKVGPRAPPGRRRVLVTLSHDSRLHVDTWVVVI